MKKFLWPLIIFNLLAWAGFLLFLFKIPPKIDDQLILSNLVYFLLLGFVSIALSLSLVLYSLRFIFHFGFAKSVSKEETLKTIIRRSLKDGFLLSLSGLILAVLQLTKTNNSLNSLLVVLIVALIEIYWTRK